MNWPPSEDSKNYREIILPQIVSSCQYNDRAILLNLVNVSSMLLRRIIRYPVFSWSAKFARVALLSPELLTIKWGYETNALGTRFSIRQLPMLSRLANTDGFPSFVLLQRNEAKV